MSYDITLELEDRDEALHLIQILQDHIDNNLKPFDDEFRYEIQRVDWWITLIKADINILDRLNEKHKEMIREKLKELRKIPWVTDENRIS